MIPKPTKTLHFDIKEFKATQKRLREERRREVILYTIKTFCAITAISLFFIAYVIWAFIIRNI